VGCCCVAPSGDPDYGVTDLRVIERIVALFNMYVELTGHRGAVNPYPRYQVADEARDSGECFGMILYESEDGLHERQRLNAEDLQARTELAFAAVGWDSREGLLQEAHNRHQARERLNQALARVVAARRSRESGAPTSNRGPGTDESGGADERPEGRVEVRNVIAEELGKQGLVAVWVAADGNCLFRAFSVALYGDETHHEQERRFTCGYMGSAQGRRRFAFIYGGDAGLHKHLK
jgi:hypothetical protein